MMGLRQEIFTSASLQKQLNTPFYTELLADKAASVGDLTPAEWNNLRNPQCLPPAPTESERAVVPASAQGGRKLRSRAMPVSTRASITPVLTPPNIIRLSDAGATVAGGFVTLYDCSGAAPTFQFANEYEFDALDEKNGLDWAHAGEDYDEELLLVTYTGPEGLTFNPIKGDRWEPFTVRAGSLLRIRPGWRAHWVGKKGTSKLYTYVTIRNGEYVEVDIATESGNGDIKCDLCNQCCWLRSYGVAAALALQIGVPEENDICSACYDRLLPAHGTLAASSELRACGRPRRETDRDAPTAARTESVEAAFLAVMASDTDEADPSAQPFRFTKVMPGPLSSLAGSV
jgi:hypothetical protein